MAIEYEFLDQSDEMLIEVSELPVEDGIAVAVRTTGYEVGADEIVELSIVDLKGNVRFSQVVKPQNIDDWSAGEASGGITPGDVAEAPELYQFEDEVRELFENAAIVVGQHVGFIRDMVESSWVALPAFEGFDLIERFCASHSAVGYAGQPAAVAALPGISAYYGVPCDESDTAGVARSVAASYLKLVEEHAQARLDKGAAYWEEYRQRKEEAARGDAQLEAEKRNHEVRAARINALLWLCAAAIFSNLAVQLNMRGFDFGVVAVVAAAAVFFAVRWAMSLYQMYKIRKGR